MHAYRIQAPRSLTPPFWFVFAGKSNKRDLLWKPSLSNWGLVLRRFSDEKWIHISVVLAMSESALIRLGVATMGDRIPIKQLCREAVDCSGVLNGVDSVDRDSSRRV